MSSSYVQYSFTPGFLVFFTVSLFSILNWSVPYSRMKPRDTNKAKSFSNKVFDVESGIALLQFRDATGKTVKMSMKVQRINSPEKDTAKH